MHPGMQVDSILEAVFMVSPKMLNLGSLVPMRPDTTDPVWIPTLTDVGCPLWGIMIVLARRRTAYDSNIVGIREIATHWNSLLSCWH